MAVLDINWKPSTRELRQFAGLWLVFFSALGGYFYYRDPSSSAAIALTAAAVLVGVPGLAAPAIMRPIYLTWMVAAFPIGWTVSHLLLGTIFYLVITPIGLVLRMLGHDPMNRRLDREATTYWNEHVTGRDSSRYFRQF